MLSDMELKDWRGSLTLFDGFFDTRPALEIVLATWGHVASVIAPEDGPAPVLEKERGVYFIGCMLKSAPLVGSTLVKAQQLGLPTIGKQRSASHVTESNLIVADLDGITTEQFENIKDRLVNAGLTFVVYSSWSHGKADKPGIRCRVVLPVDKALDGAAYKQAAQGANVLLFDGLADQSGFALHQQQGVWATSPDRVALAFCCGFKAGLSSADTLLVVPPKTEKPRLSLVYNARRGPLHFDADRLSAALAWFDSNEYGVWINCGLWMKAAYGDEAFPIWRRWSMTANDTHRADEDECQKVWDGLQPRVTPDQGAGALFGKARDAALRIARAAGASGQWGQREKAALVYLRRFHPRTFDANFVGAAA